MGLRYSCSFQAVAVTAAQGFFELTAPADAAVVLHSIRIGQSSDAGDAQAEMMRIDIIRGEGATTGSGGSAGVEVPLETGFPAAGTAVELNNTTRMTAGGGSLVTMLEDTFNVQVGWLYQPTPEERIVVSPSDLLEIGTDSTAADELTMSGTVVWEEIGG